jgi:hypothetical protein
MEYGKWNTGKEAGNNDTPAVLPISEHGVLLW